MSGWCTPTCMARGADKRTRVIAEERERKEGPEAHGQRKRRQKGKGGVEQCGTTKTAGRSADDEEPEEQEQDQNLHELTMLLV